MTTYADAVELCNTEAQYDEHYEPIPGEPTLTVGATTWFLVGLTDPALDYPSRNWVRVDEPGQGFRISGGYVESDLASVLADSETRS